MLYNSVNSTLVAQKSHRQSTNEWAGCVPKEHYSLKLVAAKEEWHHHHRGIRVFYHLPSKEHQFRQSLTDERPFVEDLKSNREVPSHCWNKKNTSFDAFERLRERVWLYLHHLDSDFSKKYARELCRQKHLSYLWIQARGCIVTESSFSLFHAHIV